jgi:hypothetical protein
MSNNVNEVDLKCQQKTEPGYDCIFSDTAEVSPKQKSSECNEDEQIVKMAINANKKLESTPRDQSYYLISILLTRMILGWTLS